MGTEVFYSSIENRVHTYGAVYQKVARECEPCFYANFLLICNLEVVE